MRNVTVKRFRPSTERLEPREVMAGGVAVFMQNGFLGVIGTTPSAPIVIGVAARSAGGSVQGVVVVGGVGVFPAAQVKAVVVVRQIGEPLGIFRGPQWNPVFLQLPPVSTPAAPVKQVSAPSAPKTTPNPGPIAASAQESADEKAIVDAVNQERAKTGLPPLAVNPKLVQAARIHADDMARLGQMAHDLPGAAQPTLTDRAKYVGYGFSYLGENIAFNYPDTGSVMDAWMGSPGHKANILSANYTQIGVGIAYDSSGQPYYCQVFGMPA